MSLSTSFLFSKSQQEEDDMPWRHKQAVCSVALFRNIFKDNCSYIYLGRIQPITSEHRNNSGLWILS